MKIEELKNNKKDRFLKWLKKDIDVTKLFWEIPFKFNYNFIGAVSGLDLSLKAMASLAQVFKESCFYLFSQNLIDLSKNSALKILVSSHDELSDRLPIEYSYLWASEFLLFTGEKGLWFVLFNAELSVGFLITKEEVNGDIQDILKQSFNKYESLIEAPDVFNEFKVEFERYGEIESIEKAYKLAVKGSSMR